MYTHRGGEFPVVAKVERVLRARSYGSFGFAGFMGWVRWLDICMYVGYKAATPSTESDQYYNMPVVSDIPQRGSTFR